MKIYSGTGVTDTGELQLLKGIGAFLIASSKEFSELTTETITAYVEKAGKNKYIAQDMLLRDFVHLLTIDDDAKVPVTGYKMSAMCEITEDGGYIELNEAESIKIRLTGLDIAKSYAIYGIEEPVATKELIMLDRKTMASDQINQDFNLRGYDWLSLQADASITEIQLTYDNGNVVKYSPIELEALSRSLDVIQTITSTNTIAYDATRYVFSVKGIINLNIRKTTGTMLNISLRIDESDKILYQTT